jgi:hypothetical protein
MSDRRVSALIVVVVAIGVLWALRTVNQRPPKPLPAVAAVVPEMVPLVTGDEPIAAIFTRAGCPVCHTIPGIVGADGRVGPPLLLGKTGSKRLQDPEYRGKATTVHEYVIESVIEPGIFVVPGYPANTMPTWYGTKLSGLALEKSRRIWSSRARKLFRGTTAVNDRRGSDDLSVSESVLYYHPLGF